MEWKYVKSLKDKTTIECIENIHHIEITQNLKKTILEYNGGRPGKRCFDTKNSKEKVLKSLISYNKEDKGNIFIYDNILKKGYIPFAITEFGDIICIKIKSGIIELYMHEQDEFEYICETLEIFFDRLYDYQ